MSTKYILMIILFGWPALSLHANTKKTNNDVHFNLLGAKDGLSQVNILSIYQDEFGVMWFGSSEGLNRYNGGEIEVFRPNTAGVGLSQNNIYEIYGNGSGSIYLRNESDLVCYNIYLQQFENIKRGGVNAIAYEHGVLWAALEKCIAWYDERSGKLKEYLPIDKPIAAITSIYPQKDGTMWIGTANGLFSISKKKPEEPALIITDICVNHIRRDSKGNLWVGTYQDGAYRIDPSGDIINYRHQNDKNSISNNQVRDFVEDGAGNLWMATFYGLNMFNPQTEQWVKYVSNDNVSHSLSHSSVFSLYSGKMGITWVGTYFGGVNYFSPDTNIFRFYEPKSNSPNCLSFPYVGKMTEDNHGNLWVCTEGGALNCLNLSTHQFSRYPLDRSKAETGMGYNQKAVWYRADKDLLYIGTHNGGLAIFDIKKKQTRLITRNNAPNSLPNNTINCMQYHNGALYLMTQAGMVRMNIDSEQFFHMNNDPVVGEILSQGVKTEVFHIDREERLWVENAIGLRAIHLKTGKSKAYLHDNTKERSIGQFIVVDIFESSKGDLFFATKGSGIFRYRPESEDFDSYTKEKNNLTCNYCYSISETPSGKLILLHNKRFALFDPENPNEDLFRSSSNFPIIGFNKGNSAYVSRNKEIFLGGINGLVSFMESDLSKIHKNYPIFFDKLRINNKEVYPGDEHGVLTQTLPLCSEIVLKHNQTNIELEFSTSNYLQVMNSNYEYKLDGVDKDWLPTESRFISYTNLRPGKYTLSVRKVSREIRRNSNVRDIDIVVRPPFYLTTQAFVLYGILILLLLGALIKFYLWREKLKTALKFEQKDKERIEELNRIKLKFFTNVSHEFRTPLTLIIGQVEMLLSQNGVDSKVHNRLVKIHKNTNHLLKLISELLDFRKLEQGFYQLNIRHVELISYVGKIYESFEDYAAKKKIKYKLDYTESDIHVYIDPAYFQKAIYNLLFNAFKYTEPGGEVTLKIRLRKPEVFIQVIDDGIGIPPEDLNKIFEHFCQLEHRPSGAGLSTGIGLAFTKEIVTAHRGEIKVESTPDKGSIFTIVIKLGTSHLPEGEVNYKEDNIIATELLIPESEDEPSLPTEEAVAITGERPVVLLVDDDEILLEMLIESLSSYYEVHTTTNGKEGLEIVLAIQPDLVISDVMMPGMSGKELCYRIKNNVITSHIPVVLLTGQASGNQIIEGYMFGADEYVTKPFNIKLLIARCNSLLKNRQLLYAKFANLENSVTPPKTIVDHHQDELIGKAVKIIKDNFANPEFDMNKLGAELGMGRSKLYVKIKEITGFTPNELALSLKLKVAADLLDSKPHMNISEIAFELGFSSGKYFTKCFKTFYGMAPQDWRKRNRKED